MNDSACPTWDDVRRIALSLPAVAEEGLGFRVGGKLFVWPYPERIHPKKARVPNFEVMAAFVAHLEEKDAMLLAEPDKFFTTDHYDGHASILVRLSEVDLDELNEIILNAWRARAPKKLVEQYGESTNT